MPTAPTSGCVEPHCPNHATNHGRCTQHARAYDTLIKARSPWRSYNHWWRKTRARILATRPLCEDCGERKATEVHHDTALRDGGTHDETNLKALCKPCHSRRTRLETIRQR